MKIGSYQLNNKEHMASELERLKIQSQYFKELEKKLLCEVGIEKNNKVIELGSGPGYISKILLELIPDGELLATEINPELFEILKENTKESPQIKPKLCSVENINIVDNWADFVYGRFIFQHLSNPLLALKETYRTTKTGGKIVTVDSDDGFINIFPQIASVQEFLNIANTNQEKYGGDRMIGRKLQNLMYEAGFRNIKSKVISFTSKDIPIDAFIRMVFGFKSTLIDDKNIVKQAHDDLKTALSNDATFVSLGIVVTIGVKT